ncbi:MAG: DUF2007 domain-containing protein [Bacteroidota bacterium]|nr:DUF2007 domain-containing protein [Bacteroidota bacterium]
MENWQRIFSTRNQAEASIIKGMLEENHVPTQLLNKMDSSYLLFGEIEIYVPFHLKEIATNLVNKALMN